MIREVTAPACWQIPGQTFDVRLEYAGHITKLAEHDKPATLSVNPTLPKTGY